MSGHIVVRGLRGCQVVWQRFFTSSVSRVGNEKLFSDDRYALLWTTVAHGSSPVQLLRILCNCSCHAALLTIRCKQSNKRPSNWYSKTTLNKIWEFDFLNKAAGLLTKLHVCVQLFTYSSACTARYVQRNMLGRHVVLFPVQSHDVSLTSFVMHYSLGTSAGTAFRLVGRAVHHGRHSNIWI